MPDTELLDNGYHVHSLQATLVHGDFRLDRVPGLVKKVLKEGMWRRRVLPQGGELVKFESFTEFMETDPPRGLGAKIETLKGICLGDMEALDLIDRAVQGRHGGDRVSKVNNINLAPKPEGTSRDAALRRLRKQRPDLHARVLAGELSPHAAMIAAGFRQPTVSVPIDETLKALADRWRCTPAAAARRAVREAKEC